MSSKSIAAAVLAIAASLAALDAQQLERWSKGEGQRYFPDDPVWTDNDTRDISPVAKFDLSKSYEFVKETFGGSAKSFGPALNVNTLGEVPDSSWFTNRLGRFDMSVADVVRGPDRVDGPAAGTWQVTGRPEAGITPKFTIKDARGDTYLIKLDPVIAPELPSSVELVSTKIFHAIGYHVPEDFIVTFDAARLSIASGAKLRAKTGGKRPIEPGDVEGWLAGTPRTPDGKIRALASRYVPGKVVGQFRFTGTRSDDPNDIYAHERRRELRGMRVFAAWLNHDDARSINSLDTYLEDGGRRYIRHYVQDFGSTLGSGSTSAQQPRGGYEYLIEPNKIGKGLASLGLWRRDWMNARYSGHLALGNVEADIFEPQKWKTEYPQPAFDQMDAADAFWAARIAARFTDDMIRAIVDAAQISDRAAASTLTDIIIRRRDKVVKYWIRQTNPIDEFTIDETADGTDIVFDNAAIRVGAANQGATYDSSWSRFDNTSGAQERISASTAIENTRARIPENAWGPADASGARYAAVAIATNHPDFPTWKNPVTVTVRQRNGEVDIVGIDRPMETSKQ
jgi:hypothetical protein